LSELSVDLGISNQEGPFQVKMPFTGCLQDKPGLGLTAIACIILMRAAKDVVYTGAAAAQFLRHFLMQIGDFSLLHKAAGNPSLIGDDNHHHSHGVEQSYPIHDRGNNFKIAPEADISPLRRLAIDDSISVQESAGPRYQ
jgi:hypothetical protein